MSRTKIIATVGPASRSKQVLAELVKAGVDVFRINFSHGTREEHGETIGRIRDLESTLGRPVAILQDLGGFKIRIGEIQGGSVTLRPGSQFTLSAETINGDERRVSVSYPSLPASLKPNDTLLLSDGAIELTVESIQGAEITCRVIVGGALSSRKGVNVPGQSVGASGLTEKDKEDLVFGMEQGVDYVALSFVRTADDVVNARKFITDRKFETPLIAKIENRKALENLEGILAAGDGIMVARGDLGVSTPITRIPRVQKELIEKANHAAKPVITATHMLRSMVDNPRPTRAEVTDVANSILDGTDAVMLSEETAVGSYPVEAVRMMAEVASEAEQNLPRERWLARLTEDAIGSVSDAVAHAVCGLAGEVSATAIVTCTSSGSTARAVARFRPEVPVLALTPRRETWRQLSLSWGVTPIQRDEVTSTDELVGAAVEAARQEGLARSGDVIVITAGVPIGVPGSTNLIKVEKVP